LFFYPSNELIACMTGVVRILFTIRILPGGQLIRGSLLPRFNVNCEGSENADYTLVVQHLLELSGSASIELKTDTSLSAAMI